MEVKTVLFDISVVMVVIMIAITPSLTTNVKAFCLWNCDAELVKNVGPLLLDCLRFAFDRGDYTSSSYDVVGGKVESRVEPGKMLDEGQLKQEWKNHPELYEHDCYQINDLTPHLMDRMQPPE